MSGIIRLHNMTFYGFHGATAAEKETGRRYEVDCELYLNLKTAAESDKLSDTVNYAEVYLTVEKIMHTRKHSLVESLVGDICNSLLLEKRIEKVIVRVRKIFPPIPGNLDHIEIEMEKQRS